MKGKPERGLFGIRLDVAGSVSKIVCPVSEKSTHRSSALDLPASQ
jgi:hypothetical protein